MTKLKSKIILTGGVFDILHYGHISFLKKAKLLGDYLIVAIESDKNVKRLKGAERPIHSQKKRKEMLEALRFVDKVIILKDKMTDNDYLKLVEKVHPSIIAVTQGDPLLKIKNDQAAAVGGKVVEISKVRTHSTTKIAKLLKLE